MFDFSILKGKHIAIVGLGYIGSNLLNHLEQYRKHIDFAISTFSRSNLNSISNQSFDYLINCAGNTGNFRNQILNTIDSNINLNTFLLKHVNIRNSITVISSTRIYGFTSNHEIIYDESDIPEITGSHLNIEFLYDGAKMLMENFLYNFYLQQKLPRINICRMSNVYGRIGNSISDEATFLKLMMNYSLKKKLLNIQQNIKSSKAYVHIDDAVEGLLRCAIFADEHHIFNISSGQSYSIEEWAEVLDLNFTAKNTQPESHSKISIELAKKELGYQPKKFLFKLKLEEII